MELKLDINYLVRKYVKQLQKQPRKKFMYAALLTSIVSALIIKFLTDNIVVILIFGASIVIFFYTFNRYYKHCALHDK